MKRLTKKAFGGVEMNTLSQLMNNLNLDMSSFTQSNIMPNTFDSPSYSSINLKPTGFDTSLNNKSKNKRQFGFNPVNYAYLQAANSLLSGVGNMYQDYMNQQSLIQNRLNPLPQVGSLSPEQKYGSEYGASFKDGGKINPPIYTNNPKDKRLKNYTDSLNLYIKGEKDYQDYLNLNKKLKIPETSTRVEYDVYSEDKIKPKQSHRYFYNHNPDVISGTNIPSSAVITWTDRYKKPVQPVIYQKQTHPIQKVTKLKPEYYNNDSKVQINTENINQIPLINTKINRGNIPVYGPGNTLIGMHDKNGSFYPSDYNGAEFNSINLQDKELLSDKVKMTNFLNSKGLKYRDGGTYYDSYYGKYFENRKDENKQIEANQAEKSPKITSSDIEENPSIVDDLLDLFSFNKRESLYRPTKSANYTNNMSMNSNNVSDGSWASKFKMVEDPQGKFNHGNGAFGTFGYRKSGHLQEAFKKSPEFEDMRKNYSNFESFWDNFTNQGYGNLSKEVDTRYESWLKRQSNNDLSTAGRFNLTGSKSNKIEDNGSNNMSTSSYIDKLFKFKEGGLSKFMSKAGLGKQSKYIQNSKQESGGIFYVDTTTLANLRTANKKFKYV